MKKLSSGVVLAILGDRQGQVNTMVTAPKNSIVRRTPPPTAARQLLRPKSRSTDTMSMNVTPRIT